MPRPGNGFTNRKRDDLLNVLPVAPEPGHTQRQIGANLGGSLWWSIHPWRDCNTLLRRMLKELGKEGIVERDNDADEIGPDRWRLRGDA